MDDLAERLKQAMRLSQLTGSIEAARSAVAGARVLAEGMDEPGIAAGLYHTEVELTDMVGRAQDSARQAIVDIVPKSPDSAPPG